MWTTGALPYATQYFYEHSATFGSDAFQSHRLSHRWQDPYVTPDAALSYRRAFGLWVKVKAHDAMDHPDVASNKTWANTE